jgi:hypothetical protein
MNIKFKCVNEGRRGVAHAQGKRHEGISSTNT